MLEQWYYIAGIVVAVVGVLGLVLKFFGLVGSGTHQKSTIKGNGNSVKQTVKK